MGIVRSENVVFTEQSRTIRKSSCLQLVKHLSCPRLGFHLLIPAPYVIIQPHQPSRSDVLITRAAPTSPLYLYFGGICTLV